MPLIIYVLGAAIFALTTSEYMVAGLMPELSSDFGVSYVAVGYLVTIYAGAMALGGPLLTVPLLAVPRKKALLGLIGLFVVGQIIGALAPGYEIMVAARLVTAISAAAFFGVALTACSELVQSHLFGRCLLNGLGGPDGGDRPRITGSNAGWRLVRLAYQFLGGSCCSHASRVAGDKTNATASCAS